jgi:hypothetical protein
MIPATEAFPKLTAGLITTDPSNVLANPDIIITIVADVKKVRKWKVENRWQCSDVYFVA